MIRHPPRSTRTDTLCPYTTLFRSGRARARALALRSAHPPLEPAPGLDALGRLPFGAALRQRRGGILRDPQPGDPLRHLADAQVPRAWTGRRAGDEPRTAERRVGKKGVKTGRTRWWPCH